VLAALVAVALVLRAVVLTQQQEELILVAVAAELLEFLAILAQAVQEWLFLNTLTH
jgi:hypothetical protein